MALRSSNSSKEEDRRGRRLGSNETEYQRPRRPNPETLQYLKSLPLDLQVSHHEVTAFLAETHHSPPPGAEQDPTTAHQEDPSPFPQVLAAALSAIEEIRHEAASLAGDEYGAEIVELLARIACPYSEVAARLLLASTVSYGVHLATHRYGSHVLQTLLQLAVTPSADCRSDEDLALHPDSPIHSSKCTAGLPSLLELVRTIQDELTPFLEELCVHMCGSHVVRTLFCVLGGVKLVVPHPQSVSLHRGKHKKKKSKRKSTDSESLVKSSASASLDILWDDDSRLMLTANSDVLDASLLKLTQRLTGTETRPPGELQQLVCHPSAGPLLVVMLRVLTYREAASRYRRDEKHEQFASTHVQPNHLGKLPVEPKFAAGSAAHRLAQRILCWQDDDDSNLEGEAHQPWAGDVIYEYAAKSSGSHVLEVLLRLSHNAFHESVLRVGNFYSPDTLREFVEHEVSNFVLQSALATLRTPNQAKAFLQQVSPMIQSGLVVDRARRRGGILWRAVEAAAAHNVYQKEIQHDILCGLQKTLGAELQLRGMKTCVSHLLCLRPPESNDGRLGLDVPGARTVYSLLRFQPELCVDTLKGILRLSSTDLELLAKDGLGSRCIWDGILEGPTQDASFASAMKQLVSKLSGRWASLASDRLGQHSVRKLFWALGDMIVRQELVLELSQGKSRLNGSAMGRSVMEACYVYDFITKGEKEWKTLVNKVLQRNQLLQEFVEASPISEGTSKSKSKKKRSASDSLPDGTQKKSKGDSTVTVDSIMNTLTMPLK